MATNNETEKLLSPKRRSKGAERQKEEGGISGKDVAMFAAEMLPGVGEAMAVKRTSDALDKKDYLGAGIEATAGLLGIIPGVGDAAGKTLRATTKGLRKEKTETIPVFPKPERMFPEGERPKGGKYLNPITGDDLTGMNVPNANLKINPDGKPSFNVTNKDVDSVGTTGKGNTQIKTNLFKSKAGWKWKDSTVDTDNINTLISVTHKGKHYYTLETDFSKGVTLKNYPESKTEPKLRPTVQGQLEMGKPIGTISVRGVEHPVYDKVITFAEGGVVPMDKQMSMFDDGGLMDEGGTIDPVSGNDVPPGSTQEEVRDDIPAQLSEGEFVMPADVVRYHGLDKMMQLRQEAKIGLKIMDEMGQMGNSEEATIPDDLPFNFEDLELDNEPREMQVGGYVAPNLPMQTQQSSFANYTPQYNVPQQNQFTPYTPPVQEATPTAPKMDTLPTFKQFVPAAGEPRKYINPETGAILMIPVDGQGNLMYPPPAGFILFSEYEANQPPATDPVAAPTTAPQQQQGRDDPSDEPSTFVSQPERRTSGPGPLVQEEAQNIKERPEFQKLVSEIDTRNSFQKFTDNIASIFGSDTAAEYAQAQREIAEGIAQEALSNNFSDEQVDELIRESRAALIEGISGRPEGDLAPIREKAKPSPKPTNVETARVETTQTLPETGATVSEAAIAAIPSSGAEFEARVNRKLDELLADPNFQNQSNLTTIARQLALDEVSIERQTASAVFGQNVQAVSSMPIDEAALRKISRNKVFGFVDGPKDITTTTKKPSSTDLAASQAAAGKVRESFPTRGENTTNVRKGNNARAKLDAAKKSNPKQYRADVRSGKYDTEFSQIDQGKREENLRRNSSTNKAGVNLAEKVGTENASKIKDDQGTATNVDNQGRISYSNDHDWSKKTQTNVNSGQSSGAQEKADTSGKIVCTEMYRQTQLDDWAKAMKIWDVYQRKYLTPYHEVGYHWLFKPYVKGMQSSNVLTKFGAFMATKRTKHLKYILTKGIAKDDIVGNIWCKIIHPIVYAAGKIKTWKK